MTMTAKQLRDTGVKNIAASIADTDTAEQYCVRHRDLGSGVEQWLVLPPDWQETDLSVTSDSQAAPAHADGADSDNYDAMIASLADVWKRP